MPAQPLDTRRDFARKIVRELDLSLEIESLDRFLRAVQRVAVGVGGYVAEQDVPSTQDASRGGTVTLRLPAEMLDGATEALDVLGNVESRSLRSQDITDQYFDTAARLANQRHYEGRLLKLIESHSGSLENLLTLEAQVATVREGIERLEGQERLWDHQVAFATIRLHFRLIQPPPPPAPPSPPQAAPPTFAEQLVARLDASTSDVIALGKAIALVVAWLAPWAPLLGMLAVGVVLLWRRRAVA